MSAREACEEERVKLWACSVFRMTVSSSLWAPASMGEGVGVEIVRLGLASSSLALSSPLWWSGAGN